MDQNKAISMYVCASFKFIGSVVPGDRDFCILMLSGGKQRLDLMIDIRQN